MSNTAAATARKDWDIYPFRFIAIVSRGNKNWFQFEQHYNHSVFNFYFFGKKNSPANVFKLGLNSALWMLACVAAERVTKSPDYTGGFVCLWRRLDECQSWWASTLRAMPPWHHNLCALWLVHRKIDPFPLRHWNLRNLTLQQECYLTSIQAFFRTFARLYNAAASPASRLRSAGSLAITEENVLL